MEYYTRKEIHNYDRRSFTLQTAKAASVIERIHRIYNWSYTHMVQLNFGSLIDTKNRANLTITHSALYWLMWTTWGSMTPSAGYFWHITDNAGDKILFMCVSGKFSDFSKSSSNTSEKINLAMRYQLSRRIDNAEKQIDNRNRWNHNKDSLSGSLTICVKCLSVSTV